MRVLVVDDEPEVTDTLCVLVERLGHEAVGVTSGADALVRFGRDRYDLVVVDVLMPDMNGLEVIRHLRGIDETARIVALTGTGLDLGDVLGTVGVRFVRKPIGTLTAAADLIGARIGG